MLGTVAPLKTEACRLRPIYQPLDELYCGRCSMNTALNIYPFNALKTVLGLMSVRRCCTIANDISLASTFLSTSYERGTLTGRLSCFKPHPAILELHASVKFAMPFARS